MNEAEAAPAVVGSDETQDKRRREEKMEKRKDPKEKKEKEEQRKKSKKQKRKREQEFDPDGTLNIAWKDKTDDDGDGDEKEKADGFVDDEEIDLLKKLEEATGVIAGSTKERLQILQKDDEHPDVSKLSEKQKLALQKRQRGEERSKTRRQNSRVREQLVRRMKHRVQAKLDAEAAVDILQGGGDDAMGFLEPENDMEETQQLTQVQLKRQLLEQAQDDGLEEKDSMARHIYDLSLTQYAPYGLTYDRSGRYALLFGKHSTQAHLAVMDCHLVSVNKELSYMIPSPVRDATYLHNHSMFAAAHGKTVAIYDSQQGSLIHQLPHQHNDVFQLQFLPYHFLLATIGRAGKLVYQDTSTGQLVSEHFTKAGPCRVMRQNPANAVLAAGHGNGTVTFWSPASSNYLVKMNCHKGAPITCCAIDAAGRTLTTGGADRQVKVWDLRMFKLRHQYFTPEGMGIPLSVDVSQRGLLAVGHRDRVTIWGHDALQTRQPKPYMIHRIPGGCGPVESVRFRPFQDVCGIGHANGISSIVIPGAGEANLDTSEYFTNPFQDVKQLREAEVRALLEKLSPDMIGLDPDQVGGIEASDPNLQLEKLQEVEEEANAAAAQQELEKEAWEFKKTSKKRGKSKIQTQIRRKNAAVLEQSASKLREARDKEKDAMLEAQTANRNDTEEADDEKGSSAGKAVVVVPAKESAMKRAAPAALRRFF